VITPAQKTPPANTQQSQETDIHAPGGIRTRNHSKRAAADPRLRPRVHWDRQIGKLATLFVAYRTVEINTKAKSNCTGKVVMTVVVIK